MEKKAQVEILGLVIVVILILLGLVFVIKYIILDPQTPIRQDFLKTQLAANMINSVLSTSTKDCYGTTLKDLIINCYDKSGDQMICENGMPSCRYLNTTLQDIFSETLDVWGKKYTFLICEWDNDNEECELESEITHLERVGCLDPSVTRIEEKQSPIPTDRGQLDIKISICD